MGLQSGEKQRPAYLEESTNKLGNDPPHLVQEVERLAKLHSERCRVRNDPELSLPMVTQDAPTCSECGSIMTRNVAATSAKIAGERQGVARVLGSVVFFDG